MPNDADIPDARCSHCQQALSFCADLRGTAQGCPNCLKPVVVPSDGSLFARPLPLPITTPRLVLKTLAEADLPDLLELFGDTRLYDFLDSDRAGEAEDRAWFAESKSVHLTDPDGYLDLGAHTHTGSEFVGYVSFYFADEEPTSSRHRQGGFTVMVNRSQWGNGYGQEIVEGIMDFGFNGIGLHDIRVGFDSRNIAACRMLEKTGMRREGEFLQYKYRKGRWVDTIWYAQLSSEHVRRAQQK